VTAGNFCNLEIVEIIAEWPELREKLPQGEALRGEEYPTGGKSGYDNKKSIEVLGIEHDGLREAVVDAVKSLMAVEAS
jgi:hypothetical protein